MSPHVRGGVDHDDASGPLVYAIDELAQPHPRLDPVRLAHRERALDVDHRRQRVEDRAVGRHRVHEEVGLGDTISAVVEEVIRADGDALGSSGRDVLAVPGIHDGRALRRLGDDEADPGGLDETHVDRAVVLADVDAGWQVGDRVPDGRRVHHYRRRSRTTAARPTVTTPTGDAAADGSGWARRRLGGGLRGRLRRRLRGRLGRRLRGRLGGGLGVGSAGGSGAGSAVGSSLGIGCAPTRARRSAPRGAPASGPRDAGAGVGVGRRGRGRRRRGIAAEAPESPRGHARRRPVIGNAEALADRRGHDEDQDQQGGDSDNEQARRPGGPPTRGPLRMGHGPLHGVAQHRCESMPDRGAARTAEPTYERPWLRRVPWLRRGLATDDVGARGTHVGLRSGPLSVSPGARRSEHGLITDPDPMTRAKGSTRCPPPPSPASPPRPSIASPPDLPAT